jgi:two-component system chemotaxis sensor kinase CheA
MGMVIEPGTFYLVGTFYPLFCIVLSCIVLIRSIVAQSRGRRLGLALLLVSSLAPLIANFAYVAISFFYKSTLAGINFTAFVMVISNFIFFYNVIRNDLFDFSPKAYAITMDLIRDAFVVLDRSMAYMGSNKKAIELFPALSDFNKGASVLGLENWPQQLKDEKSIFFNAADDLTGKEIEFNLPNKPGKIYSAWANRVTSGPGATLGWVILIQDITETVNLIRNIQAQRDEIAAMRDNLKEGIFLMDRDLRIQDSFSKAMEDILSVKNLHGRKFTDLLSGSYNPMDMSIIADYFDMIMEKKIAPEMLEDMNPLTEFLYTSTETEEQKTLRCLFAPVAQGGGEIYIMGTIQDISAEILLKKQLAEEEALRQNDMRNLFEVMQMDQKVFRDFVEDADIEFRRAKVMLQDKKVTFEKKLINLYQSVHAIKSNALITGLSGYGEKLHALESKIKTQQEDPEGFDSKRFLGITDDFEKLIEEKEKFPEILKRLRDFSASLAGGAIKEEDVFLKTIKQACERVASAEGKKVVLKVDAFDKAALKRGPRRVMKDVLMQLVRNAVHHGIEKPKERLLHGKKETGKINLSVKLENDKVRMILSDDGQGLDFSRIAKTAQAKGLLLNPKADKQDQQLLSRLIFNPGFSTSETEDMHAGRGIGLNLVKDRLKEVHGKINIQNKTGQGLVFDIQIPLK